MARARSHGGASANSLPILSTSPDSGPSHHETTGLLSIPTAEPYDDDDESDDAVIVHAGPRPTAASRSPLRAPALPSSHSSNVTSDAEADALPPSASHTPRTPRTPNRVRFDLRPTIVNNPPNGSAAVDAGAEHHHHARESFDMDEEDPLSSSTGSDRNRGHQRVPLLTGIEAPSVALANDASNWEFSGGDVHAWAEAERLRPKSGLRMAFMNMANSIIGAGIIGQPYAFRQAGLLAGLVLLVVLTVLVDWTICLIVVNSKLSGASSFQGTVEKCFGKTGLIAISVAQWAFAFGGMVAFGVIVGDSIPHVLQAVWPGLRQMPVLGLLADRRVVIVVFTLGVSYPLALYRDIAKLAKASTMALVSMGVIVVTVVVQGILAPQESRGQLNTWNLLVINDGVFQAIGVISFGKFPEINSGIG